MADRDGSDSSAWPYGALIMYGHLGRESPGGRQLAVRTTVALAVVVAASGGLTFAESLLYRALWAALLPAAVAAIAWSYARYLAGLDELSRLIQLQAFAVAYGAAMTLYFGAFAVSAALGFPAASVWTTAAVIVAAEPVRGAALVRLARKYS